MCWRAFTPGPKIRKQWLREIYTEAAICARKRHFLTTKVTKLTKFYRRNCCFCLRVSQSSSWFKSVLQAIVDSDSSETVTFWWKVSCAWYTDFLRFYIDGTEQAFITGDEDWQEESFTVSSGIHTLKWVYEDNGGNDGENCGWVDFVQWTGPSPTPDPNNWNQIEYKHDVYGRRVEKKVDGFSTRYVYDGAHVIAEYDGNNNLLRKYMYGPGIDQPVCMIEVADSNVTYYYHYDALGSVVALSDSSGDTVQTYEYSVFGEPAVEDANHTNPYMFAGRRLDIEIGLYYNRARYYNPYTGRFLQTDPSGYSDGTNWYAYCGNEPVGRLDPSGLSYKFVDTPEGGNSSSLYFAHEDDATGEITIVWDGPNLDAWYAWAMAEDGFTMGRDFDLSKEAAAKIWLNSGGDPTMKRGDRLFWELQALVYLGIFSEQTMIDLGNGDVKVVALKYTRSGYFPEQKIVAWNRNIYDAGWGRDYSKHPPLASLAHEFGHAIDYVIDKKAQSKTADERQHTAISWENKARNIFYNIVPDYENLYPRPDDPPIGSGEERRESFGVDAATVWKYYAPMPGRGTHWLP